MTSRRASAAVVGTLFVLAASSQAGALGLKVVAHPSVPVSSISRQAISEAFLKKSDKWPDGTAMVPVEQAHDSAIRESFCRLIHERSVSMIDAFWQKQVFSGRATPPITKGSDADVIAYVRSVPGAVGYVSSGAETSGLKELKVE